MKPMSYSRMLHDFVENDLPGSQEETLFHALAGDEDLRFELKYLLSLRGAVESDAEAGAVPLASTGSIFSRLGYAMPAATGEVAAGAAGGGLLARLFDGRTTGYLLSGLLGLLLGASLLLTVDDRTASATIAEATAVERGSGVTGAEPGEAALRSGDATFGLATIESFGGDIARSSSPAVSGVREETTTRSRTRTTSRSTQSYAPPSLASRENTSNAASPDLDTETDNDGAQITSTPTDQLDDPAPEMTMPITAERATPIEVRDPASSMSDPIAEARRSPEESIESAPMPEFEARSGIERTLAVTVRNSHEPIRLVDRTIPVAPADEFDGANNLVVGLVMPVSDEFAFVMEGGSETYLMTFKDVRPDGSTTIHEVEPTVLWGTAGIRYSPLGDEEFSPFVQVSAGGSGSGMVERGMLGFEWSPGGVIDMNGGIELSAVQYLFDGSLNTTPRLGLTYGVRLNLFGSGWE